MTSNAKWLKLQREKLDQDAAWVAAQRASLDEIEVALGEANVAVAKGLEARAKADDLRLDLTPEGPTVH